MLFLKDIDQAAVSREPYPHVLIESALDADLSRRLAEEFPPLETFTSGSAHPDNSKIQRNCINLLADPGLSPLWREVIEDHLKPAALLDVWRLLGDALLREYPDFETRNGKLEALRIGVRGRDDPAAHDVLLDAQLIIHTPVTGAPCIERGPHVKLSNKFMECQIYLPREEEDVVGAEIEVFEQRPGFAPVPLARNQVDPTRLRLVRSVRHRRGTVLLFLITPRSFSQVAIRGPGRHPLQYFCFLAQLPDKLFPQHYHPLRHYDPATGDTTNWPPVCYGQDDLAAVCAPRHVHPVEHHMQNELYGFAQAVKEYADLPPHEPLPWAMEHAIRYDQPDPHPADVASLLPLKMTTTESQAEILRPHVSTPVLPIGCAFFYALELFERRHGSLSVGTRRGTVVFPDKCTHGLDTEFDRDRFAAELTALPSDHHPVVVCIYWNDFLKGHDKPYRKAGLKVVSCGHPYDPFFLYRFIDLCRHFTYACANDISTSFCLSVLCGCRFFYLNTGQVRLTAEGVTKTYEAEPTLAWPSKQACLAASPYPPVGNGSAQRAMAARFAGEAFVRPPQFFRDQFKVGRRLLLARMPPAKISFIRPMEPDHRGNWLAWGMDTDGWAGTQCGLTLRAFPGVSALRMNIQVPAARTPQQARTLSVEVCGLPILSTPVREGRWMFHMPLDGIDSAAPLVLRCEGGSNRSDGRVRSVRVAQIALLKHWPEELARRTTIAAVDSW
jgi:hypothetical protein